MILQNPNDGAGVGALVDQSGGTLALWVDFATVLAVGTSRLVDTFAAAGQNGLRFGLVQSTNVLFGQVWGATSGGHRDVSLSIAGLTGWHHCALVYGPAGPVAIYLDGVASTVVTTTGTYVNPNAHSATVALFSAYDGSGPWAAGYRDQLILPGVQYTAAQIAALYASQLRGITSYDITPAKVVQAIEAIKYTPSSGLPQREVWADLVRFLGFLPVE